MLRPAAATLLVLATAAAVEEDYWLREDLPFVDIRLGYGLSSIPKSYSVGVVAYPPAPPADYTAVDGFDTDTARTISYSIVGGRMTPIGLLFGGELTYSWASQRFTDRTIAGAPQPVPANPATIQYRTFGGSFLTGVGWALTRNVHIEGLGVLGIGGMDLDFVNAAGDDVQDGGGWYWNAGVRAGAYFTWRRLVLGGLVEWSRVDYTADANWPASRTKVDDVETGVHWRVEIGYHIQ